MIHKLDLSSILALVVGVCGLVADTAFQSDLTALFGPATPKIISAIAALGLISSQVLRIIGSPSSTPPPQQEAPK